MAWKIRHLCCFLIPVIIFLLLHFRVIRFYRADVAFHCAPNYKRIAVPPIIHQIWTESLPQETIPLHRCSWKLVYPKWKYMLWSDKTNRLLVKNHFPWFLKTYDSLEHDSSRADVARYMILYVHGGIYADVDVECIRPFTHLLNSSVVLGAMQGESLMKEGYVENSFMVSVVRHPFWLEMLHYIEETAHNKDEPSNKISGHDAFMTMLKNHRAACPKDVIIYPPKYFNPFSWKSNTVKACKTYGKMTEAEYKECKKNHAKSYVIRYHVHAWD